MHTRRAALLAVVLAAGVLLGAGSALAGGPTSALLVEPATGNSASLTYVDKDYTSLMSLVGADDGSAGRIDQNHADPGRGPDVTVTWLIHNVSPWRVDHIYLNTPGGPWIATEVGTPESDDVFAQPAVWHTAEDGPQLTALLERIGLIGGDPATLPADGGLVESGAATEVAPSAPESQKVKEPQAATSGTQRGDLILTAMFGIALGVALTVAGRWLTAASGRRRSSSGTKEVASMGDDGRESSPVVDDITWSSREELSSVLERT